MKVYYVYIMSSLTKTLYTGVSSALRQRVEQHKNGTAHSFTSRYKIDRLVYFEEYLNVTEAIAREKQVKAYRREKKVRLIESMNPEWEDLPPPD
jgi:putative endonuclease